MEDSKIKVVYVTTDSFMDHSYTIAKYLKQVIEIKTYIIGSEKTDEIDEICKKINGEFIARPRYRNPFAFLFEFRFLNKLRKEKADVIWFDSLAFLRTILVRLFIKEFLVNIHDYNFHPAEKDYIGMLANKITYMLHKKRICVVSHTAANYFKERFGINTRIFQLPIIDYYLDFGDESSDERKSDILKFFFFSSIEKYKGIEILLDAVEILGKKNIPYQLNIYGKLKYNAEEITGKVKSLKNVNLINTYINYKKVHKLYTENDVLVLPYTQVTQCGPLLIGYAEGVPSICNDLPGFREYVDEGKSGLFFNGTADNLADKMEYIINNRTKINEMSEYIKTEMYKKLSMEWLKSEYVENLESKIKII